MRTVGFFSLTHTCLLACLNNGLLARWLSVVYSSELKAFSPFDGTGFSYDASCSIAGSFVVVEDSGERAEDRRLVVCLDGGNGQTLVGTRVTGDIFCVGLQLFNDSLDCPCLW